MGESLRRGPEGRCGKAHKARFLSKIGELPVSNDLIMLAGGGASGIYG
jgi:hypothetical protein